MTEGSMTKDRIGRTTMFGDGTRRRRRKEKKRDEAKRGESDEAERGAEQGQARRELLVN